MTAGRPVLERGNPAPFSHRRGPVGSLLLHGFPGSPAEMRLLGDYLADHDVTVIAPLFPGHGTIPEDLFPVRWRDWVAAAEAGLAELRRHCGSVIACGLSVGGAIALHMAARLPMAGVVALAPAIRMRDRRFEWVPVLNLFVRWHEPDNRRDDLADPQGRARGWHYRRYPGAAVRQVYGLVRSTRRLLRQVQVPTLLIQSRRDRLLSPEGARWAFDQIPATDKALIWLERLGHNVLLDLEKEGVHGQVQRFVARVSGLGE